MMGHDLTCFFLPPACYLTKSLYCLLQYISLRYIFRYFTLFTSLMQIEIFPYSVFYIFFEQYLDIWRIALINIAIALGQYYNTWL